MTAYVALLRAVNVGGTGKLPMVELRSMCEAAGFGQVRTYIASGNVVFSSELSGGEVGTALDEQLQAYAGKPIAVLVRSAKQMGAVLADNPFSGAEPNRTFAFFLDAPPPANWLDDVRHLGNEQLQPGAREIYAYYPDGIGTSKLVIPAAKDGTARNMNTIAKLAAMAQEISE